MSEMQSDEIGEITAAMVKVQSEIGPAIKGKVNPFFKSSYATLGDVWESCRGVLHDNGIAVIQGARLVDGKSCMETKLVHTSGQWFSSLWEMMPAKADPQSMGSAITYMRRYSLSAMVGILSEDDDGNAASKPKKVGVKGGVHSGDESGADGFGGIMAIKEEIKVLIEQVKAARSTEEIMVLKAQYEFTPKDEKSLMDRTKHFPATQSWHDRVCEVFAEMGAQTATTGAG